MGGVFHLFTLAGVPVSATPWFAILLFMFARGSAHPNALSVGICVGLLVHEMGHALVARYLRRSPSIVLHGFGGLTHHEQTARGAALRTGDRRRAPSRAMFGALSAFLWPSLLLLMPLRFFM
jgi:hypothetical protein